ncbi:MAG: hypothetical protein MR508_03080 [Lachnospiraceae bacterium]|nr:hypothetical protein [Lachnospiraceae bacterium]
MGSFNYLVFRVLGAGGADHDAEEITQKQKKQKKREKQENQEKLENL